ncbi:smg-9, nonsense mediated mRNA decay factor [Desmophyllum pertusum]|uniref:Smg-9, nonsense mediated mRNA decay factor n=1 Tax=Desmophyllum pertusum TaxID=174260 RepID=A0A9W9Y884_9CNID|nr:smg-9, nonsense mediated mRNA decay factor [Desmophyllum pertusum]
MEDQDRGFRRGRGGRRRERGFRDRSSRGKGDGPIGAHATAAAVPMKTPIILTKPSADRGQETPVKQILIKPRESLQEGVARPSAPQQAVARGKTILSDHAASQGTERSAGGTPTHGMGGATASTVTGASANVEGLTTNLASLKLGLHSRDGAPQLVKLLDENLQWNDSALEEDGTNQTAGIDMSVTQERVILLDTQPLLSAALLDRLIHHDRNIPPEYTSPENYNEIQSLQIVTFLLTVCHVIIVVQDWFTDPNIIRLLKTAEMLKPSSASHTTHESSGLGSPEESDEHYPNIVFVLFQHSRLKLQSGISLLSSSLMPYRTLLTSCDDMNIYVVPLYRPHGDIFGAPTSPHSSFPDRKKLVPLCGSFMGDCQEIIFDLRI